MPPDVQHDAAALGSATAASAASSCGPQSQRGSRTRPRSGTPSAPGPARPRRRRCRPRPARRARCRRGRLRSRPRGTRRARSGSGPRATWRDLPLGPPPVRDRGRRSRSAPARARPRTRAARAAAHRAVVVDDLADAPRPAAGRRAGPGRRAASVCPGRRSTPPSLARSGNTWPGRVRSLGLGLRVRQQPDRRARSAAEMPVVTPSRASTETVYAVLLAVLVGVVHRRQRRAVRSPAPVSGTQMQPLVQRTKNATSLGRGELGRDDEVALVLPVLVVDHDHRPAGGDVREGALDGGEHRGRTLPTLPAASAALDVLRDDVDLEVHRVADRASSPSVVRASVVGISATVKVGGPGLDHGQADPVHRDRALLHQVAGQLAPVRRCARLRAPRPAPASVPTPSTWPCTRWPPSRVGGRDRALQVDRAPAPPSEVRPSVSATTSTLKVPPATPVTVRQTPLTAIESPSAASLLTSGPRIVSRVTSPGSLATISPSSSTMPVNTPSPGPCGRARAVPGPRGRGRPPRTRPSRPRRRPRRPRPRPRSCPR